MPGNTPYSSRVLWSDAASGDNSPFPYIRPGGYVSVNHAPPPDVYWTYKGDVKYGLLSVYGITRTNWGFDDGSAKTLITPNIGNSVDCTDDFWKIGSGNHGYLIPKY